MNNQLLFKNILFSLILIGVFFGFLEISARLIYDSNTNLNIGLGGEKEYHPTRKFQLKKNYKAKNISINSHGILGPEFDINPNPNGIRILTMGNSCTFIPSERNYSRVLEENLSKLFPKDGIEVICAGIPGYDSFQLLDWYNDFLFKLEPDIAIIYIGWNDIGQYHPFGLQFKNQKLSYQERSIIGYLMENLYFLRIPYYFLGKIERNKKIDKSTLTFDEKQKISSFKPDHYYDNIYNLITKLQLKGSKTFLVSLVGLTSYSPTEDEFERMTFGRGFKRKYEIYKSVHDQYQIALEKLSNETESPLISINDVVKTENDRKIFYDIMHTNLDGAQVYGDFITNILLPDIKNLVIYK